MLVRLSENDTIVWDFVLHSSPHVAFRSAGAGTSELPCRRPDESHYDPRTLDRIRHAPQI